MSPVTRLRRGAGWCLRAAGLGALRGRRPGPPGVAAFLASRGVDLVVDVGAGGGQFALSLRRAGYRGRITSFEPVSGAFAALARAAAADPAWDAHRLALGSAPGQGRIAVTRCSQLSSFLPQAAAMRTAGAAAQVVGWEDVAIARLDDAVPAPGERAFLKVDAQGFERQVLAGAPAMLRTCLGVQLELPLVHLYKGGWGLADAVRHMEGLGFVPCQFHPVGHPADDPASAWEVDCVFRRRDARDDG